MESPLDAQAAGPRARSSGGQPTVLVAATIVGACVATALAIWLVTASVQIVGWSSSGAGRVALFAPAAMLRWLLGAAAVAAAAVWLGGRPTSHVRRQRAAALMPLNALWTWTIPFLPWLPDRLPLLLVFGGPVRWLVFGAAVAMCIVRLWPRGAVKPTGFSLPGRKTAGAVALLIYLFAGHRSLGIVGIGGDEPHYLVIVQSLLLDGDIQIENNHQRGDYRAYFGGPLRPDYLARGLNGAIYSIHAPGLPVLVAPVFALAGAAGVVAAMGVFGALAALAVFDLAALVGGLGAAWATWASVCLTVPFVPHAWSIFPEMPGAAITAWALLWIARDDRAHWSRWLWRGACLAALPWLHTKFAVLVAVLALALLFRVRREWRSALAFVAPLAVSMIGWLAFFRIIYGTFDPQAPYGTYAAQFVMLSNIPRGLMGSLFDQKFGLIIYAPIYVAVLAGVIPLLRDVRWRLLAVVSIGLALVYLVSNVRLYMWWGGSSAPGRFLVPVAPMLAPALAMMFARVRRGLVAAHVWLALGVSLFVSTLSVVDLAPPLLFSSPHGVAKLAEWFQAGAPLTAALPTFTEEDWRTPLLKLVVWAVAVTLAVVAARWMARPNGRRPGLSLFASMLTEAVVLLVVASLTAGIFSAEARAEVVQRGRLAMLTRFDPDSLRALDYRRGRFGRMTPDAWLEAGHLTFEMGPPSDADSQGRLTEGLTLPAGSYRLGVMFRDAGPHAGDLMASLGGGQVLARAGGPLGARVALPFTLPVEVPQLWVQLSDPSSAPAARRVEINAVSVVPRRERLDASVSRVESIQGRANAYLAYVGDGAFPEGGVFWTRGTDAADVLVVPAGARRVVLTLHIGPGGGTVRLQANGRALDTVMAPNDTRTVVVEVPDAASYIPIRVQAPTAFKPADIDAHSTDQRLLGCQVRVDVSGGDAAP